MSTAILSCLHRMEFEPAPKTGDLLYCRRCTVYVRCIVAIAEWRLRCEGSCHFGHRYGADEQRAREVASTHAMKFPSHRVNVYYGGELVECYYYESVATSLPGMP